MAALSFATLTHRLRPTGWSVIRALPRTSGHALLVLRGDDGRQVAGQWFADPTRAHRVAESTRQTRAGQREPAVGQPLPDVVVQAAGLDRRLPALAEACATAGSRLVSHRPERRGVIEQRDRSGHHFTKFVRPERLTDQLVAAMSTRLPGVPTPQVVRVDRRRAAVTTAALPGRTLHEWLAECGDESSRPGLAATWPDLAAACPDLDVHRHPAAGQQDLAARLGDVGRVLARLHASPVPDGAPMHDVAREVAVLQRWIGLAHELGVPLPDGARMATERHRVAELLAEVPAAAVPVHRDLHDKQIVFGRGADPALLDLDLLSIGDPALDLANLVVHLELRARQGLITPRFAEELAGQLVGGYRPDQRTRAACRGYLLATRLRLVCVYAFRPASIGAARMLLADPIWQDLP